MVNQARDLSILIPSRNEQFLPNTVSDILSHITSDTEIIVVLDGLWPQVPIESHPRVNLIYHDHSIGQRAAINEAARISTAEFVMKCDAHCAFDQGFDTKMIEPYRKGELDRSVTSVPRMYNLHVFDWKCKSCDFTTYQGPKPESCVRCKGTDIEQSLIWKPRLSRQSDFMRFDHTLHFQYWGSYGRRPEAQSDLADQMSCVGACWMMSRARYWEIEPCDEEHGSWGQQGTEVACKSWLSGGRQIVNKRTWFAHLFRTQPGFGFPYPQSGKQVDHARDHSRNLWFNNAWPRQTRPLSWLIDHFSPIPDWTDEIRAQLRPLGDATTPMNIPAPDTELHQPAQSDSPLPEPPPPPITIREPRPIPVTDPVPVPVFEPIAHTPSLHPPIVPISYKGLVYYTDNQCPDLVSVASRMQTVSAIFGRAFDLVSVSLGPIPGPQFGRPVIFTEPRGILAMFKQILAGLETCKSDIVFLVEHDMLYHPSHFDFTPPRDDTYYYNEHTYKVDSTSGQALFYFCKQTSGLCAYRPLLIEHYKKRVSLVSASGYNRNMGFEPGTHRPPRGVDNHPAERWMSPVPNIDIRHSHNLTPSRWSQDKFRNKNTCLGWTMTDTVPGWGTTKGRFESFLSDLGLVRAPDPHPNP